MLIIGFENILQKIEGIPIRSSRNGYTKIVGSAGF